MTNIELSVRVAELLGVEKMTVTQQNELIEKTVPIIIESSLNRLLVNLNDEDIAKLEDYLNIDHNPEDILEYLLNTYPQFESILQEEIVAFQEIIVDVLE